ncbi:MAG: cytochrome-c peroxidase, partial [Deltaproteobacteria bacterium]|nr:cytochrome-c peroxidase [Deltaproteobacteria bacterium]
MSRPIAGTVVALVLLGGSGQASAGNLERQERLGKSVFFDEDLSSPRGVACASCHDPSSGFADPRKDLPVSRGSIPNRFGSRNAPSISYSALSPELRFLQNMGPMNRGVWQGGQNWDGSAVDLVEQAKRPFLNPLEMNNPSAEAVVRRIDRSDYRELFHEVCGEPNDTELAYDCVARAIAAYEASEEVNPQSSKFDLFLQGRIALSPREEAGRLLFEGKAACARCHVSRPSSDGSSPMFTSRHHANVGLPRNPANPFYSLPRHFNRQGAGFVDLGTGAAIKDPFHYGRFKIPSLRNVAETAPYGHNGVFGNLETVVHFYNTRDVPGAGWPAPEWSENIIRMDHLGDLGLTAAEEADLVTFL